MKKILVIIDYQNDFVCGSYGFDKAKSIEQDICKKIVKYKNERQTVLFTLDTHFADSYEIKRTMVEKEYSKLNGYQLYGDVKKLYQKDMLIIGKHTPGSIDLASYLLKNPYDYIEIAGVVTDICVISNAVIASAACPEAKIIIDEKCVASNNETLHKMAIEVMKSIGFTILNSKGDKNNAEV